MNNRDGWITAITIALGLAALFYAVILFLNMTYPD